MNLTEALRTRRSVRKFQNREVATDLLLRAIETAVWTPNANNLQLWKFFVVKDRATIDALGDAVQAKADMIASWPQAEEFGEAAQKWSKSAANFRAAPALVAIAYGTSEGLADKIIKKRGSSDPSAVEVRENRLAIDSGLQSAASAAAALLLALHGEGLAACWMTGPMIARREMEKILNVPPDMGLFVLVPVGYPADLPAPPVRKPLGEVVTVI